MLSVVFILAATLTLLPAVLGQARPARRQALAALGALRRAPLAALRRLGRAPVAPAAAPTAPSPSSSLVALALPVFGLKTGMPSIKVVPERRQLARRLHPGAGGVRQGRARARCRSSHRRPTPRSVAAIAKAGPRRRPGHARHARRRRQRAWCRSSPSTTRPTRPSARPSTACAPTCPPGALVGGAVAENHDLEAALSAKTPLVIGVVLALGFLLLLVALQAPIIAAVGRAHQPAGRRRRVRRRPADLPGGPLAAACSASSRRASWTRGHPCSSSR